MWEKERKEAKEREEGKEKGERQPEEREIKRGMYKEGKEGKINRR